MWFIYLQMQYLQRICIYRHTHTCTSRSTFCCISSPGSSSRRVLRKRDHVFICKTPRACALNRSNTYAGGRPLRMSQAVLIEARSAIMVAPELGRASALPNHTLRDTMRRLVTDVCKWSEWVANKQLTNFDFALCSWWLALAEQSIDDWAPLFKPSYAVIFTSSCT